MLYLLDSNHATRAGIQQLLSQHGHTVVTCNSFAGLLTHAPFTDADLALVAWQTMGGLLADEHRDDLARLAERVPMAIMVPRNWLRFLNANDLGVKALLPRPFDPVELLVCVSATAESATEGAQAAVETAR